MQDKSPRIGLFVAMLLLATTAAAQDNKLYRWVDKEGHVHYGDQPGPSSNASEVNLKAINSADSAAIDPAKAAAAQKQAAACKQKADQFSRYQNASSITETDSLGNEHQYTPEEKNRLIARTQKYLDDNCGGAPAAAPAASPSDNAASTGTPAPQQ